MDVQLNQIFKKNGLFAHNSFIAIDERCFDLMICVYDIIRNISDISACQAARARVRWLLILFHVNAVRNFKAFSFESVYIVFICHLDVIQRACALKVYSAYTSHLVPRTSLWIFVFSFCEWNRWKVCLVPFSNAF